MKTKYREILFQRIVTQNSPDQSTISFEPLKQIKQVACSEKDAAAFNAGKLNYPNPTFTLLLQDTDPDPGPIIIKNQIARRDGEAVEFRRPSRLGWMGL